MAKKTKFNIKELLPRLLKKRDTASQESEQGGRLVDKVGDFFNYETGRERVLSHEDFKGAGDPYYASVSAGFKVAERLLWLMLAVFMTFSLLTSYRDITYSNMFYLFREFSSVAEMQSSDYQVLSYDSDERQRFALFHGGIVSASPSFVSMFTSSGRRTLKSNTHYDAPNVVASDKYVLVYDTASSSFSVYNSFSKIHDDRLGSAITAAALENGGSFAIAVRKNDVQTHISVYNKDIELAAECTDNRFLFGMSLAGGANRLAAAYYSAGDGRGITSLCIYDIGRGSRKEPVEISLMGEFPIQCTYLEGGQLALITDRAIRIYDDSITSADEQPAECIEFDDMQITAFNSTLSGASVALGNTTRKKVIAFDKNGILLYNSSITENVSDIGVYDKTVFLQTGSGVVKLDTEGGGTQLLECDSGKMLVYSADTVIVCGDARAEYIVFK